MKSAAALGTFMLALASCLYAQGTTPPSVIVAATQHSPDEFGTQDYSVTVIDAASFTADTAYTTDYATLSRHFAGDVGGHFFAGVSIPSGVVIDYMGTENRCAGTQPLITTLFRTDRFTDVPFPVVSYVAGPHPNFDTDYTAPAPFVIGYQFVQNAHNALVIDVNQSPDPAGLACDFRWVEIWWRRVVTPAPFTASFNDVPTSHPFFQYIEALKSSGITGGCQASPPLYCPDSPVTRSQLAVFLAKALGLYWSDAPLPWSQ